MEDFIHVQFLESIASLGTKGFCLEEMGSEIEVKLCYLLVPSEKKCPGNKTKLWLAQKGLIALPNPVDGKKNPKEKPK